ncbi:MAG: hypothetical protein ACREHG_10450 [Candidatus Saccharimonadales bacterium]
MTLFNDKQLSFQEGSILLLVLITLPFLIMIAVYYTTLSLTSYQVARQGQLHTEAQMAADAGADYAVEQINQSSSWTGTGGEVLLHSDSSLKTTFTVSVTGDSSAKAAAVTGYAYWPANASTARSSVSIYVDLYPVSTGNYSIVTGAGGLQMSNNSKIVGGNVFINGQISLSNSAQIGLSTNPVNVQVADQACPSPADSTYPRVCTSGDDAPQPISLSGSSHIYGTVTATNQTDGSGMSDSGLVAGGSVSPQALPSYSRSAQEAAVTNNMTGSQASCSDSQSVVWPANTKITGNVTLSNSCTVTVEGNIWITGNFTPSNSSKMIIADSVGTTMPNIMVDGSQGIVLSNAFKVVPNSQNTGAEFYTFWSDASCSPECASVTGTDLYNSRNVTTISISNSVSAANSIFYAYWSKVQMSNAGEIGAVIGQTVGLSNAAAITFGTPAGGTGYTSWQIKGYRRQ